MKVFCFDQTFDGLLTVVFEAYARRTFPDAVLPVGASLPLFCEEALAVATDEAKAARVWRALQKKLSSAAQACVTQSWLAEEEETPTLLFRYICKVFDTPRSIETDFADADVLAVFRMWRRVQHERERPLQFIRFQKGSDGTYFAAVEPEKNALPLVVSHFQDRFADQRWLIYDLCRAYGFYHDSRTVRQVHFAGDGQGGFFSTGRLAAGQQAADEELFRCLWKTYFHSIAVRERLNPRKQRNDMPVRYWKHLTEKQ